MTLAQFYEMFVGRLSSELGFFGMASPFEPLDPASVGNILEELGLSKYGDVQLYNGITGKMMDTTIFMGPIYYLRLKLMVRDKINARASGNRIRGVPVPGGAYTLKERQTVGGRAYGGGLRIGEMERDAILSHGTMSFLKESIIDRADRFPVYICNQSGRMAIVNPDNNIYYSPDVDGPVSHQLTSGAEGGQTRNDILGLNTFGQTARDFSRIEIPYTCKLLIQEVNSTGIDIRFVMDEGSRDLVLVHEKPKKSESKKSESKKSESNQSKQKGGGEDEILTDEDKTSNTENSSDSLSKTETLTDEILDQDVSPNTIQDIKSTDDNNDNFINDDPLDEKTVDELNEFKMDTQPKGPYHIDNDQDKEGNENSENPENKENSEENDIKVVNIQTAGNYHSQHNYLTPQNTTIPLPSIETPKQEITNLVQEQNSQPNQINPINLNPINPVGGNISITSSEDLEKELNEFTLDLDDPSNSINENQNHNNQHNFSTILWNPMSSIDDIGFQRIIENNNNENNEIENLNQYEPKKDLNGLSI